MTELSTHWLREERGALARARGRRKLDVFLDSRDPEALVRSLPAEDLYFAIHDIGVADAAPLVHLATPEQFRTFVDLDAWKGDDVDPERLLLWLRLARTDDEGYREKLAQLDLEILELLILGTVRIFDLEEDGEPGDDVEGNVERTVDGRFAIVYPTGGAEYGWARQMIDDVYSEDPFRAGQLLYAVRWEISSELTETALRWRNARLADLGFPSPEEAASLYAKVDLHAPLPPPAAPPQESPGFFLAELEHGSLLDRAMGLVPEDAKDELQVQLVALMNAAMVADRVEPGDLDAVRDVARAVRATLALGLAHLVGDDPVAASSQLLGVALKRIFQIGFTRTLELSWTATRLVRTLPLHLEGADGFLPESPDGEALAALLRRRPRYHGGLDGPAAPPEDRPFATLAELDRAAAALERIEALGTSLSAASLDVDRTSAMVVEAWGPAGLARVRFGELFLTAAVRHAVGLPFAFEALPDASLDAGIQRAFQDDGRLRPAFRDASVQAYEASGGVASEAVRHAIEAAFWRLEDQLGPQLLSESPPRIDPRFAAPLIVPHSTEPR